MWIVYLGFGVVFVGCGWVQKVRFWALFLINCWWCRLMIFGSNSPLRCRIDASVIARDGGKAMACPGGDCLGWFGQLGGCRYDASNHYRISSIIGVARRSWSACAGRPRGWPVSASCCRTRWRCISVGRRSEEAGGARERTTGWGAGGCHDDHGIIVEW